MSRRSKLLRIGISEDENAMPGNKKINQLDILGSIISKDGECFEDGKSRIAKTQGVLSMLKKVWKNMKISVQTRVRILGTYMLFQPISRMLICLKPVFLCALLR